ncbi:type VI secretion system protein TssA [uncultured Thiodictyon sp.]|uniref:type VI secretion system protein TssA n=1 Tax=uncultured Thiodictyon sp. TaxID=1846217 RepID=UPI0025F1377E|nr:type VI secretion system protein TssA [uncultured Thiodictyon sp.]
MDISHLGKTPVPGPAPAGEDARYDTDYADLLTEIGKLSSVTQTEPVVWPRVVELAARILATRSKDLQAATYLAVGQTHLEGLAGLAAGLQVLRDLLETYWADAFPPLKRLRGRVNALNWWRDETTGWLQGNPPAAPLPPALHQSLTEGISALDQTMAALLPDCGSLRELIGKLQGLPVEPPPAVPPPAPPPDQPHATAPPAPVPTGTAPGATSPSGPTAPRGETLETARAALAAAALNFAQLSRAEALADPWTWKANRLGAWLRVAKVPPSQGGQTLIPAPDEAIKSALLAQLNAGRFMEAATMIEEQFTGAIFWFDLHRLLDTALEGLGADYTAARAAIRAELSSLLVRLPGVDRLAFADGTPFADPQTQSWIGDLQSAHGTQGAADPVATAIGRAQERFAAADQGGALDDLTAAIHAAADGASRLRLRHAQMGLLGRAQRFDLAAALAEHLLAEIASRGLTTWQPDLALELLLGCHHALAGRGADEDLAKARRLAVDIGLMQPSAAMNLPP